MRDKFLVFGSPQIEEAEIDEVVATMRSGWLGTGPKVARFEEDFRAYLDVPHAAAVNSCTAALHLGIIAAGLEPGDEVASATGSAGVRSGRATTRPSRAFLLRYRLTRRPAHATPATSIQFWWTRRESASPGKRSLTP